jgi:hypothetical protein
VKSIIGQLIDSVNRKSIIVDKNIGGAKKQALPITEKEEDTLW